MPGQTQSFQIEINSNFYIKLWINHDNNIHLFFKLSYQGILFSGRTRKGKEGYTLQLDFKQFTVGFTKFRVYCHIYTRPAAQPGLLPETQKSDHILMPMWPDKLHVHFTLNQRTIWLRRRSRAKRNVIEHGRRSRSTMLRNWNRFLQKLQAENPRREIREGIQEIRAFQLTRKKKKQKAERINSLPEMEQKTKVMQQLETVESQRSGEKRVRSGQKERESRA